MNYVIRLLEKEKQVLTNILNEWEKETYPEARKMREKRLNELETALNILKDEAEKV